MTRRFVFILTLLVLAAMSATGAVAMPIHIDEGRFAARATDAADGSGVELNITDFQLVGRGEAGDYIIFADGRFLNLSRAALQSVLGGIGSAAEALPSVNDYGDIGRGSKSSGVAPLQDALISLGYLEGTADGDFGQKSQDAVSRFQRDHGLNETGVADALTQMLVYSSAEDILYVLSDNDPERVFSEIIDKTGADLSKAVELGMTLDYDDIAGEGEISNGNAVVYEAPAESDIDRCDFTVRLVLRVERNGGDELTIRPAMKLECLCVRRPVMREVMIKSGDGRVTLEVEDSGATLSGVNSLENGIVYLNEDAVSIVAGSAAAGELKLRVVCKYGSYDIIVPGNMLKTVADVAQAARAL